MVNEQVSAQNVAVNVKVGEHIKWDIFGVSLHGDTIISTLVAGGIVILLGLWVRRKVNARKPSNGQLFFETVTEQVEQQVEDTMGIKTAPFVVPLAMTLFVFILIANLIAIVPTGHHPEYAPPPASDVNLTYALAIIVIGTMHVVGIRKLGLKGFYGHLFEKPRVMIPLRLVEEIMKPITLALRLFGNIFAGTIMVALIAAMPAVILWLPDILWKLFDAFIGLIQAFIFALLTVLYMSSIAPHEEGAH
jgi:F-type H+-transporting ATPase subunit a